MAKFKMRSKIFDNDIVVYDGFVTNTVFVAKKDWFIKNCTTNSKIDAIIKKEDKAYIEKCGKEIDRNRKFPINVAREFFEPKYAEDIEKTGITIGSAIIFKKENGGVVGLNTFFANIVESGMQVKYDESRFLFYDNDELVLVISEVDLNVVMTKNKIKNLENIIRNFS